jgi:type I restriction enzyme S subunit
MEWFSAVPDHWDVLPCRAIVDERNEKNEGLKSDFYLSLLANIGIIPYEEKGDIGNKKPEDLEKCKLVERGDLVINSMNYGIGSFGLSELSGVCSPVYIVLRPKSEVIEERFALRIFECRDFQTYAQSFGNGILAHRAAINWDILKVLRVPVPPRSEQNLILQYLDQETGKIDALVAEQERLIALLKEKRQAVVSQAVTKGLNPNAPMKDSGFEWLGQVPAHWPCVALKHLIRSGTSISYGIVQPGEALDDGVPFVQTTNMTGGTFDLADLQRTSHTIAAAYPRTCLEGGEVLLGIRASVGACHVVPLHLRGANLSRGVARIVCDDRLVPDYLVAFLRSRFAADYWALHRQGSTFSEVSIETVREISVPVPSIYEQRFLVAAIQARADEFEALILEAKRAIALLKERRAALISAAVTGKIDVRSLTPTEQEAA